MTTSEKLFAFMLLTAIALFGLVINKSCSASCGDSCGLKESAVIEGICYCKYQHSWSEAETHR